MKEYQLLFFSQERDVVEKRIIQILKGELGEAVTWREDTSNELKGFYNELYTSKFTDSQSFEEFISRTNGLDSLSTEDKAMERCKQQAAEEGEGSQQEAQDRHALRGMPVSYSKVTVTDEYYK